jgi:hypothetical protein
MAVTDRKRQRTYGLSGVNGWEAATTGQVFSVSGRTDSTGQYAAGVSGYEGAKGVLWLGGADLFSLGLRHAAGQDRTDPTSSRTASYGFIDIWVAEG